MTRKHVNERAADAAYELRWDLALLEQRHEDRTFAGGVPHLPAATTLPDCRICGSQMAFFFQAAPPRGILAGRLLSVWCCVRCADDDTIIPEMPDAPLSGVELPDGFLERYQTFFRLLVVPLETSQPRPDYQPLVAHRAIALVPIADDALVDRLGGEPSWLLDDETPGSYHGAGLQFMLQVMEDRSFDLVPGAPHQIESDPFRSPVPTPREEAIYELFIANRLFFFVSEADPTQVYVFTQID